MAAFPADAADVSGEVVAAGDARVFALAGSRRASVVGSKMQVAPHVHLVAVGVDWFPPQSTFFPHP